jgi:hypothetical protein
MDNHEMGLVLEGAAVADIAKAIDLLIRASQTIPVNFRTTKT